MKILVVKNSVVPPVNYGGSERVADWLVRALIQLGHEVSVLSSPGSISKFYPIIDIKAGMAVEKQIPAGFDIIHFHDPFKGTLHTPYINTIHGVADPGESYSVNSVFVSSNQARLHGSKIYIHHGINYDDYTPFKSGVKKTYVHFLAKTRWKIKNIEGAIRTAQYAGKKIEVMGNRLIEKATIHHLFNPRVHFNGMISGGIKDKILQGSMGLIFPTLTHETFGLAMFESMYYGCPVFGTPYGSLPELITLETGYVSNSSEELGKAIKSISFSEHKIHEYARDLFNAEVMAKKYIKIYETVLNGKNLHTEEPHYIRENMEIEFPFY